MKGVESMFFICMTSANDSRPKNDNKQIDIYLKQISNGDKEALSGLYHLTDKSVYSFALSILKNADDAQDVLQDVFIKIYSSASSYKSAGKPMAWILTITKNICFLKLREKKKQDYVSKDELENCFSESAVSQDDKIVLYQCLNNLSDEERQIVVLHTVSGLKHREIAELLGLPLSTVLSKYNRSLKKLKLLLEGE